MRVKSQAKWIRMSPRKLRRIIALLRGKGTKEAMLILKYLPHRGAREVEKVLKSAVANAKNNYKLNEADLFVDEIYVDQGPTLKRWRARARGRAFPIAKRTSHITVFVESEKGA